MDEEKLDKKVRQTIIVILSLLVLIGMWSLAILLVLNSKLI